jgi:hypothetical protein
MEAKNLEALLFYLQAVGLAADWLGIAVVFVDVFSEAMISSSGSRQTPRRNRFL